METKHTPGPWRSALKSEKTWNMGVYTEGGDEVAHIAVKSAFAAQRRDADARLIASAPELLDALRAIEEESSDEGARECARAAIAKAEGK